MLDADFCDAPSVSVIMPAYNAAELIDRSIRSVLWQTHRDLELIVVDDGSSDGTWELVKRWERDDPRVVPIRQANAGVAHARNRAIEAARGEFLAPIDADDLWLPTKIEKQVAAMREGGPRMGLVYAWWVSVDEEEKVVGRAGRWTAAGDVVHALTFVNFIGNASVPLFRTDLLRRLGGYNATFRELRGQGCEDWDVSLRVARASRVGVVKEYLVGYRQSSLLESMSCDTESMSKSYRLMMDEAPRRYLDDHPDIVAWSKAHFYLYLAGKSYSGGDMPRVVRWIGEALAADPLAWLSPYALRTYAKARARQAAAPLTQRVWPDHASYIRFRRRFRLRAPWRKPRTFTELADARAVPGRAYGWRRWKPYDQILIRRWRALTVRASAGETIDAGAREFSKATI